ncbi:phage DNA ejection protein [Escherichia coli]|uniref:phage DNA ejection protein n=1 Tax=Escherichia coli TaxID=562 RepID=UPI00372D6471
MTTWQQGINSGGFLAGIGAQNENAPKASDINATLGLIRENNELARSGANNVALTGLRGLAGVADIYKQQQQQERKAAFQKGYADAYASGDREQRRLVGDALNKKQGPYKDADKEALSRLYGALAEDQKSVLSNTGYLRDFEVAQRLVAMRKNLERQMVNLRGKTLNGDIAYKVTNSLQSMAKGDARGFREIMQNTPSRTLRRELVGTALRDMLSSGKRGADFNPSGFADWWQNLQHSGQLKTLAEHLPKETMSGLYDVYKVARAIKNAKAHEISTGKLNEFVNRFNRVTAPYELAAKHIQKIGTMVGAHFGSLGAIAGADIGARLASKARLAGGAGAADAADKLIASPAFQSAVKNLHGKAPGHIVDSRIRRSPQWKSFFNSLPEQEKRTIARLGIITWLSNDPDND